MKVCVFLFLFFIVDAVHSAKILIVMPFPLYSHNIPFIPLFKALADRGHQVTYLSPYANRVSSPNMKSIQLNITVPRIAQVGTFQPADFIGLNYEMFALWKFCPGMSTFMLSEVVDLLPPKSENFDLVIVEPHFCQEPFGILGHYYNAHMVTIMPGPVNPSIAYHTGTPTNPSYIPLIRAPLPDRMSFWERIKNTVLTTSELLGHHFYLLPLQDKIMRELLKDPDLPYLGDALNNVSLSLVETHYSINYARPYSRNVLEIGGMSYKAVEPLPDDLEKYIRDAKDGVIYFSWGSHFEGKNWDVTLNAIMESFKYVKQRVLFKMSNRTFPFVPDNVMVRPWFPQPSVLSHKNVVLFISHCGLNSIYEAIYHGVPILGTPIFADQPHNSKLVESLGIGEGVDPSTITGYSKILTPMKKILSDPSYRERAKMRSAIMKDRPMPSLEEAIYWLEYVVRYGGAPHLRPASVHLPWYQFLLLDVIAFFLAALLAVVAVVYLVLRKCFARVPPPPVDKSKKRK